jgi:hypothetical protein
MSEKENGSSTDGLVVSQTLQLVIEKKAEARLKADFQTIRDGLTTKVGLMDSVFEEFSGLQVRKHDRKDSWDGKTVLISLRSWFWSTSNTPGSYDSYAFAYLRRKYLPKYIDRETREFVASVTELKGRMGELEDYYGYLNEQHNG